MVLDRFFNITAQKLDLSKDDMRCSINTYICERLLFVF